jgi:hypothetical protein
MTKNGDKIIIAILSASIKNIIKKYNQLGANVKD